MVNTSPRLRDSLDYEDPEETDPRLFFGFGTLSINSAEYEDYEPDDDHRPIAGRPFPSATRRKGRQRRQGQALNDAPLFEYHTTADGDVFRVVTLLAGTGDASIQCRLDLEDSRKPRNSYRCLSYCWGATTDRNVAILLNGFRFAVTENLHKALQCIRKANSEVRIWVDQICINQSDYDERAHQVSIMKYIFSKAKVVVWLGEEDDRSRKLCEYARKTGRGDYAPRDSPKTVLNRILSPRQLQDAVQKLLQRQWFTRVWVIPEVALASFTEVAIGNDLISWDNLVRLIKDTQLPHNGGFDKQTALLGNPRQRIAILSQMAASQREGMLHTDITQLLILAKSSDATDHRDKVYAFFGLTLLSLRPDYRELPDYKRSIERLYVEIAKDYVNNILYVDYYSKWHSLSEQHRTQQLMSMLYSAGRLHQHFDLPSWVPDWTFAWYQAPFWCTTDANLANFSGKDEWSAGIRSQYRAGGEKLGTFELGVDAGRHCLRVSALIFDRVVEVSETTPASTPGFAGYSASSPAGSAVTLDSPTFSYGRGSFKTKSGLLGMATKGVQAGDALAIIVGGDVPVVLRAMDHLNWDRERDAFILLCECFVQSHDVMGGEMLSTDIWRAEDIDIT
ncbi:hypothetical protein LTR91_003749 [Friedmanniomyces endolithicus]|uniref:Heterokaryon incompatibility domain-containing protein n=2 Tax=Dothideomycetidae TaxID=451867 RepID=A0AAN6KZ08_9PEZI|nr:hypothetical protein LTR94_010945 [Friedmanniomyces endolithicus]KAK0772941.1 hypothetical protein LTR38_016732 [Friedmanniomyces endolithicus]KAK0776238.1 hypothetical protein LTR59_014261 [Friedmanniomyces endolithicus]KAK0795883.1 hypothetical protein LTR75_010381 [Friedmanniomyces endolithicus]KAK0838747.1 hypothetical protein LTR03_011743 [Friedmanniomyces endolithicus]